MTSTITQGLRAVTVAWAHVTRALGYSCHHCSRLHFKTQILFKEITELQPSLTLSATLHNGTVHTKIILADSLKSKKRVTQTRPGLFVPKHHRWVYLYCKRNPSKLKSSLHTGYSVIYMVTKNQEISPKVCMKNGHIGQNIFWKYNL